MSDCKSCGQPPSLALLTDLVESFGRVVSGGAEETVDLGGGEPVPTLRRMFQTMTAMASGAEPYWTDAERAADAAQPEGRLAYVVETGLHWRMGSGGWTPAPDRVAAEASARTAGDAALATELEAKAALADAYGVPEVARDAYGLEAEEGAMVEQERSANGVVLRARYASGSTHFRPTKELVRQIQAGGTEVGELSPAYPRPLAMAFRARGAGGVGPLLGALYRDGGVDFKPAPELVARIQAGATETGELSPAYPRPVAMAFRARGAGGVGPLLGALYRDGGIDFKPAPELIARILGTATPGGAALTNLDERDILFRRAVGGLPEHEQVWAGPPGMAVAPYVVPTRPGVPRTALMRGAVVDVVFYCGQSNSEGHSDDVLTASPPDPARALMLSTGMLGARGESSLAHAIPGLLPAHEARHLTSPALGETPASAHLARLARRAPYGASRLCVGRVTAQGGQRAAFLGADSVPYRNTVSEARRIVELLAPAEPSAIRVWVCWIHGETDATYHTDGRATSAALYKSQTRAIFDGLIAEIGAIPGVEAVRVLINQAGTNRSLAPNFANVPGQALEQMVREDATGRLFMGTPHASREVFDNWHSRAIEKARQGEENALAMERILRGETPAPQVEAVEVAGGEILVDFRLPQGGSLSLHDDPTLHQYGFRLHSTPHDVADPDAGADIPLLSVRLAEVGGARRRVVLTPAAVPATGQELRCGFRANTRAAAPRYGARPGVFSASGEVYDLDGEPIREFVPVFTRTL